MIITPEGFYSFDKKGLMAKLERSTKYVPDYILKKQIKEKVEKAQEEFLEIGIEKGKEIGKQEGEVIGIEKGKELGKQEGKDEERTRIAAELKAAGVPLEAIQKATGLPAEVIAAL